MLRLLSPAGICLAAIATAMLFTGCGSGNTNYPVSGVVTYDGKPVPVGEIVFEPDASKGNSGAGSVAAIKDGAYSTASGKGVTGGPYIIRVTGFDGVVVNVEASTGSVLFPPYEEKVDLPKEGGVRNIEVPKK